MLKKGKVSTKDKQLIYNIVLNLENKTTKQKNRFNLYYKLNPSQTQEYTMQSLSLEQKCSISAIRISIVSIKRSLVNLQGEEKKLFLEVIDKNIK